MVRAQTHKRFSVARPATPGQDQSSRTRGLIAPAQPANLPFAELQPLSRLKTPQSAFNDRLDDLGPDRVRACVSCSAHVHSSFASGRRFTRACALQPGEESDIPNEPRQIGHYTAHKKALRGVLHVGEQPTEIHERI